MSLLPINSVHGVIFDSSRLLFFPVKLSAHTIHEIQTAYSTLPADHRLANHLNCQWQDVKFNPFSVHKIGICTSKRCSLCCTYCLECSNEEPKRELPNQHILLFVSDALEKKVVRDMLNSESKGDPLQIYFTGGGEPTYDFNSFTDLVLSIENKAKDYSVPTFLRITTNGFYNRKLAAFLCDYFSSIMISYDGMPAVQNRNRPGLHQKETASIVESNIKYILSRNIPLTIRTTVTPHDVTELKCMADYMYSAFGNRFKWSLYPVKAKGRAKGKGFDDADNTDNLDFCEAFLSLREYVQSRYGTGSVSSPAFTTNKVDLFCGSIASRADIVWLRADGRIVTCLEMGNEETIVGHVTNECVEYKKVVSDAITRITQERMSLCKDCIAFPFCAGGCPADHQSNQNESIKQPTWACLQKIKFWEYIMRSALAGKECFGWKVMPSRYNQLKTLGVLEFVNTKEDEE